MFRFLEKFRKRGYNWLGERLRNIRGKWGEEYVVIGSLWAAVSALWSAINAIWSWLRTAWDAVVNAFMVWAKPVIIWLQAKLTWLLGIYSTYIKPVLDWVNETVKWLKGLAILIQGKLDDLVKYVYNTIFGGLEELRKSVQEVFNTMKGVVSVFSKDLVDSIQRTEDKFFRLLDSFSRDIRDWAIDSIHKITDPIIHKLTEISLLLDGYIRQTRSVLDPIEDLITKSFEKPKLLTKDTVQATGSKWGKELWDSMFKHVTINTERPKPTIQDSEGTKSFIDHILDELVRAPVGTWRDVEKRLDEELTEIVTGKPVTSYTPIQVLSEEEKK